MKTPINVAVVGLGGMGQMHLGCYRKNPLANVLAICDIDPSKLSGAPVEVNIANPAALNLSGVQTTTRLQDLLERPDLDLIDICVPTHHHAPVAIAALKAGKHVLCEKPMAWNVAECAAVIEAQKQSGKFLLIGHCLRFWPQYVKAAEMLASGDLGKPLYAALRRTSGAPVWSHWYMDGQQSGGVVLDMHIHDIDTALWWFGTPESVSASGVIHKGLPLKVDSTWKYQNGLSVQLHGGWDLNQAPFRMAFEITGEAGTLSFDSSRGEAMSLVRGTVKTRIEFDGTSGYGPEIDYFLDCIGQGKAPERTTPHSSAETVRMAREELAQIGFEDASES